MARLVAGDSQSNPVWEQIRDRHTDLFQTTFAFSRRTTRFNLAKGGQTDFVDGVYASGLYFNALRVMPMLGRSFTTEDEVIPCRSGGSRRICCLRRRRRSPAASRPQL